MRKQIAAFVVVAGTIGLAAPAMADTLEAVIEKGIVLKVEGGIEIPVSYRPDGTFVADVFGTEMEGTWRIDGKTMCTTSEAAPEEECSEYPEGKGPGDEFEMSGPQGVAIIAINE